MNSSVAIALSFGVLVCTTALAQLTDGPKPSNPILKRAPSAAQWTVSYYQDRAKAQEVLTKSGQDKGSRGDTPDGAKLPKSLTVSKSGNIYHEVTQWANGRTTEKWVVGDLQLYLTPSGRIARSILPPSQYSDTYTDYRRSDFEELEWVGQDNFQGVKDMGGLTAFEFHVETSKRRLTPREKSDSVDASASTPVTKSQTDGSTEDTGYTAYLDLRTQLPLYFDDGRTVQIFEFSANPPTSLVVPEAFAAEFDAWKKELNRWTPRPRAK